MSFSLDSEELMKLILPDFDNFLVKKTPLQQKKLDNILKILYNDIKLAERWSSAENTLSRIKTHLKDKEESKTKDREVEERRCASGRRNETPPSETRKRTRANC